MNNINVLVFPCNIESGTSFIAHAQALGANVIYASSVATAQTGKRVHALPYVNTEEFTDAFLALLDSEDIGYVYSEHDVVLEYLHSLKANPGLEQKFTICNEFPYRVYQAKYAEALDFGAQVLADNPSFPGLLTQEKYASLFIQFNMIPGMSDNEKLKSLVSLFNRVPSGDVVEIGSYWGRSAYALGFLAQQHCIGSMISVDPWDVVSISSQGEGTELVNKTAVMIDWDAVHSGFIVSVSGLNNVNYIRKPAEEAISVYQAVGKEGQLTTAELGTVPIAGEIALLHIDGNHQYEQVKKDILLWLPHIKPGGWILVDDYEWSFGDGPKRAGDELLNDPRVTEHFTASDTLFIRL
ncbi:MULTISPECIES: class I SAM-dependent methyltransferase [Pseudescherichia]|uniref:class I SAM-dependent methyltransferase n=1 Tax=Pseudescherichia TaxID=2055880 RepID=UPI00289B7192|nr:class I SAM-dependent methyltransferase [Pseudescherichia sp.]